MKFNPNFYVSASKLISIRVSEKKKNFSMTYRYLEDIATADAAFEVSGKTLEELFTEAAIATFEIMADTKTIRPKVTRDIYLEHENIDQLLFDWLSELIYLKDAEYLIFSKFDVRINKNKTHRLSAKASGDIIDNLKHNLRSDVKSVTYHLFEVKETEEGWFARIIVDI